MEKRMENEMETREYMGIKGLLFWVKGWGLGSRVRLRVCRSLETCNYQHHALMVLAHNYGLVYPILF